MYPEDHREPDRVCTGDRVTLHILVNPITETIVNAVHDDQLDGLRRFVKHHTEEQGQPLARIIVTGGKVKVIQAGDEVVG